MLERPGRKSPTPLAEFVHSAGRTISNDADPLAIGASGEGGGSGVAPGVRSVRGARIRARLRAQLRSERIGLALALLACLAPGAAIMVMIVVLVAQVSLASGHFWTLLVRPRVLPVEPSDRDADRPLVFSVHVATCDEPPALVIATLESLDAQIDPPDFEVIVMDNNTADPAVWHPVRDWCQGHGRFRFLHEDRVEGAKAGALNIAFAATNPKATHVVVVDADYQLTPDFLALAAGALGRHRADFVQFPQAYRSAEPAAGVVLELSDYFTRHARFADAADAMLLTGTLSVIDRRALAAADGWSAATLTEDAALGLRLRALGYHGRLDSRVGGHGLLPLDFAALERQRYRWAAGNLASLGDIAQLPSRTAAHVFAQLTAWTNLALPAAACLAGGWAHLTYAGETAGVHSARLLVELATVCLCLIIVSAVIPLAACISRAGVLAVVAASATRVALVPSAARGTIDGLFGTAGAFQRTPKSPTQARDCLPFHLAALALLGATILAYPAGVPLARFGAVLLIAPAVSFLFTARHLANYRAALAS